MPAAPHTLVWRQRLIGALGVEPQTMRTLSRRTAVPTSSARRILEQLVAERLALRTTMQRERAGGVAPVGWRRMPEAPA